MKYTSARSLIAGLGFTLVAVSALAQTSSAQTSSPPGVQPQAAQSTPAAAHGGADSPLGKIPQAVIEQLALTPEQKLQFDAAQVARKDGQANKQSLRAEQKKAMDAQFAKDTIDPRALLAQHKQMRTAMETRMEAVQQKWLTFWDGLTTTQKTTLSNYIKSKHAAHTQKKPTVAKG